MTVARLTSIATVDRSIETPAERVRRLQAEARSLAAEQVEALADDLQRLGAQAAEIASGGEAYPAGVRDVAGRLASDLSDRAQLILVILGRTRGTSSLS